LQKVFYLITAQTRHRQTDWQTDRWKAISITIAR